MVTRQQMSATFGEANIVTAPAHPKGEGVFPGEVSEVIFRTGLPAHVPGVFALRVADRPKAFNVLGASDVEGDLDVLCIGAPSSETSLRYCVDIERGHVVLVDIKEENARLVNTSLSAFMEFLFRIGQFQLFKRTSGEGQEELYFDLLLAYLSQVDSFALNEARDWWLTSLNRVRLGESHGMDGGNS